MTGILAVLLFTCFVKIATTLSIFRFAIGLKGLTFGLVMLALSLALTLLVMSPQVEQSGGLNTLLALKGPRDVKSIEETFLPFMAKHTDQRILGRIQKLSSRLSKEKASGGDVNKELKSANKNLGVIVSAFLISELSDAFKIGFILLVPFVVIDLLVVNVLMALGIQQMSPLVVSLPLKILLFLAVDGWTLISERLIGAYI